MNVTAQHNPRTLRPRTVGEPVGPASAGLRELLDAIGEGAFERERDDIAPFAAFDLIREYGFGAFRVPRELGGGGATLQQFFEALIDLAAVDPNVAHALRSHFIFVDVRLGAFARGEESKWLTERPGGALFGNATTELGDRNTGGQDAGRFRTTLEPAGDGHRLNGEKFYCTGSLYFDWVPVAAATPAGEVVSATVPVDRAGVHIDDDWDGIGQRLTASGGARFDNVAVAADEVAARHPDDHFAGHGPTLAQLYLTAVVAGILQAAAADAVSVLRGRSRTFSHGAGPTAVEDPLLQHVVGRLATNAFVARAVVMRAVAPLALAAEAAPEDAGHPDLLEQARIEAAMAKVAVDELAARSGWEVFDVGGASATRGSLNLDRHWRNARTVASHNPSIYKTRALGDRLVNQRPLPASNLF